MSGLTKERITDGFVDLSFRVPSGKAELAKRVMAALIQEEQDDDAQDIEDVLGPTTPGAALRGYRYREGLTQKDLAAKVGASAQNISDMESGRRVIGKDMAQRLGAALNAPWRRLLTV